MSRVSLDAPECPGFLLGEEQFRLLPQTLTKCLLDPGVRIYLQTNTVYGARQ